MEIEREKGRAMTRPVDIPNFAPDNIPLGVYSLERYVHETALARGDLRRGQSEALVEVVNFFREGGRVGYVEQVSRYGKSRLMEEIGKGFAGTQVYITPHEAATNNIEEKLKGKVDFGRVDKDHKDYGHRVTAITMPMLQQLLKKIPTTTDKTMLSNARKLFGADIDFPDELHHYLTPKGLEVLATFLQFNPKSVMIGATATDGYNEVKNAERLYGKCLHRINIFEAVDEGVLISPHVRIIKTGMSLDNAKVTPQGDYIFDASVPMAKRDDMLLDGYLEACEEEKKKLRTISYLTTKDHAYGFASRAEQKGVRAKVITGETKDRRAIYGELERREIDTIATIGTAIESIDLPWLEGILDGAPSRSWRLVRQKWPRAMTNIEGKSAPWIIQLVDDGTSYSKRPLLVPEMLGVKRFVNGAVVNPIPAERGFRVSDVLDPERRKPYHTAAIQLSEGEEKNISLETIDINSLFRMSLLDKAELLNQGLLPNEIKDHLRDILREQLKTKFQDENISPHQLASFYIYDEDINEYINFAQIVRRMFGIESLNDIRSHHVLLLENFFESGQIDISVIRDEIKPVNKVFMSSEFSSAIAKYRSNEADDLEKGFLAIEMRKMLVGLDLDSIGAFGSTNIMLRGRHFS
ncbi:MAG: hypothetical protein Q7T54_02385, partial [Candidatus Levybacteria bacterium]|nr:hypothetical protein [Candidatus Levybacteria bacterium]